MHSFFGWKVVKKSHFVKTSRDTVKTKSTKHYLTYKEKARSLVMHKLMLYKNIYKDLGHDLDYNKVAIRNQSTRWGSCSSRKNLNFNYKIIFLPEHLIEYIIAHELCHLLEMNHGSNFWKLVSLTIPDYYKYKKELCKIRLRDISQINL